jgi:hypothetical protein
MLVHFNPTAVLGDTENYNLEHYHGSFPTRKREQLKTGVHWLELRGLFQNQLPIGW